MIVEQYRAKCDEPFCGFESDPYPTKSKLYDYMLNGESSDGRWYLRNGRHICAGCLIARACRIFGHVPDAANDYWCSRCMRRIGPSFEFAESCHFCGTIVNLEDREYSGTPHSAKDCRPDLFEHEIGDTCTWRERGCYWDHDNHELTRLGAWWNGVTT